MTQLQENMTNKTMFNSVQLLKHQTLGIGAYGKVCKAKCDDLLCAAKVIHETLLASIQEHHISPPQREHGLVMRRFEQECEFMSAVKHPNIVQFLDMYQDPDTGLPVLLMELMDDSLTHFLESSTQPIPYHIQVNICHDITLALLFLHSNNIVHRDLSSNNILLIGNITAKVTDFGMARLCDLNSQTIHQVTYTMCPGTDVYMPPEAIQDRPVYNEKIDCFSFGVVAIQVLTQEFPDPGDRHITVDNSHYPHMLRTIPERERRHNHISLADQNHPMLQIALDCLEDNYIHRPSAQQLCERVAYLKTCPEYSEGITQEQLDVRQGSLQSHQIQLRHMQRVHGIIQSHMNHIEEKDQIISAQLQENQQLRELLFQKSHQIESLQQEVQSNSGTQQWLQQQLEQTKIRVREKEQLEHRKDMEVRKEILRLRQQLEQVRHQVKEKDQAIEAAEIQLMSQRQRHIQQIRGLQEIISSQRTIIDKGGRQLSQTVAHKEGEIHLLKQQLDKVKCELEEQRTKHLSDQVKIEVERQLNKRLSQVSTSDLQSTRSMSINSREEVAGMNVRARTGSTVCNREEQPTNFNQPDIKFEVEWRGKNARRAPCGMVAHCNAVVCGEVVYFQPGDTKALHSYNTVTDVWSQLPDCKNQNSSMAIVNNLVTVIGGSKLIARHSKKLYSLTGEGKRRKWTKLLPPMLTKRSETTALCTRGALIVAGGEGKNGKTLTTVEVMNTEIKQWSTATDLPEPLWGASAAVCGDLMYMVGGVNVRPTKSVYRCSVNSLLSSCQPAFACAGYNIENDAAHTSDELWSRVSDPPVTGPTCVSLHGRLLLVGGEDSNSTRTTAIHIYNRTTDSWEVISHMSTGRNQCFAAVLPDNQLMVVGGWIDTTQDQTASDAVDFADTKIVA